MMVEGKSPLHTATNYGTQGSDACPDLPKSPSGGRSTPTAILVYLCAIGEGYDIGVFATVLVRLQEAFQISSKTLGILAAVLYIGAIVGACTAGPLADWVGRKKGLSVACIFLTLGTSMMALASGITSIIVGRIIMGIGVGLGVPLGGLYIVEISPVNMRGTLGTAFGAWVVLGVALGSLAGTVLQDTWQDWRVMLFLGAIIPIPVGTGLFLPFFPESPRWLALQNRTEEVRLALSHLLMDEALVEKTFRDIATEAENSTNEATRLQDVVCPSAANRNRVVASVGVVCCMFACGHVSLGIYLPIILAPSIGRRDAVLATGIISVVASLNGLACAKLPEIFGRRSVLLVSHALHIFMLVQFTFATSPWGFGVSFKGWWLVGSWVFGCFAYSAGIAPVSLMYTSEVLPLELRATGVGLSNACGRVVAFFVTLCLPVLVHMCDWMTYGGFVTINCLVWVFIYKVVVETQGVELENVYKMYAAQA